MSGIFNVCEHLRALYFCAVKFLLLHTVFQTKVKALTVPRHGADQPSLLPVSLPALATLWRSLFFSSWALQSCLLLASLPVVTQHQRKVMNSQQNSISCTSYNTISIMLQNGQDSVSVCQSWLQYQIILALIVCLIQLNWGLSKQIVHYPALK